MIPQGFYFGAGHTWRRVYSRYTYWRFGHRFIESLVEESDSLYRARILKGAE